MLQPADIDALIDERPQDGAFRVHADVFRRRDIFDLEMKHIFEGGWVFVGFEFQIPNPHDFLTTRIGRQPVIVSRDADGKIHGLINSCRHRGAVVCESVTGNRKVHVCPYHAWAYDSAGRNVAVPNEGEAGYTAEFARHDHSLRRVGAIDSYRGFIFASLNPNVVPLPEFLGDTRVFLDLAVDQSPDGLELVPGTVTYTFNGNWKMQIENSADAYHFVPTHTSLLQIYAKRKPAGDDETRVGFRRVYDERNTERGSFTFPYGHNVLWGANENPELRAIWVDRETITARVGAERFKWMLYTRNLLVFPNFQLLETSGLQVRVNRPLAPDKTEITTYCVAPKGESKAARVRRLRQYEEFYNPSGLATPDDMAIFDACQSGQSSEWVDWHQGYLRGLGEITRGTNAAAQGLGVTTETSVATTHAMGDETIFHSQYRAWRAMLKTALGAPGNTPRLASHAAE